jgi:ANTAR domain
VPRGDSARNRQLARVDTLMTIMNAVVGTISTSSSQLRHELEALIGGMDGDDSAELISVVAALRAENEQLREALIGRAVIEQAKGILMLRQDCEAEEAFDLLRELSRRERRKVRDLAAEVVRTRGESVREPLDLRRGPERASPGSGTGTGNVVDLREGSGSGPHAIPG